MIRAAEVAFAQGRLEESLLLARDLEQFIESNPDSVAYSTAGALALREDAQRRLRTLEHVRTLSPRDQRQVCRAESLRAPIRGHRSDGDYASALRLATEQLSIRQRLLEPGDPRTAYSRYWCGIFHSNPDSAELYLRIALGEFDTVFVHSNMAQARARCHLGRRVRDDSRRDRTDEAYNLFHDALGTATRLTPVPDDEVAWYHHFLGRMAFLLGHTFEAELLTVRGHEMAMRSGSRDAELLSRGWEQTLSILIHRGRYYDADRLLDTWVAYEGSHADAYTQVQILRSRGYLEERLGDTDRGMEHLKEAMLLAESEWQNDPRLAAQGAIVTSHLSSLLASQGQFQRAKAVYHRLGSAYGSSGASFDPDDPLNPYFRNFAAAEAEGSGEYEAAVVLLRKQLQRSASNGDPSKIENTGAARRVAFLEETLGHDEEALNLLHVCLERWEAGPGRLAGGRHTYVTSAAPYGNAAALHLRVGDDRVAWNLMERFRGQGLESLLAVRGCSAGLPWVTTRRQRALERNLQSLPDGSPTRNGVQPTYPPREAGPRVAEIEALWASMEQRASVAMLHTMPLASSESSLTVDSLQRALDPRWACVGWLDVEWLQRDEHWVYAVTRDSLRWAKLDDDRGLISQFRAELSATGEHVSESDESVWRSLAAQLYRSRLSPVGDLLQGASRVLVIPSGPMLGIPVEALVEASGTLLGDRCTISYAPSAGSWLALRGEPVSPLPKSVLCVGAPNAELAEPFDLADAADAPPPPPPIEPALALRVTRGSEESIGLLPPLPGSDVEIRSIASSFSSSRVLAGNQATEAALDAHLGAHASEKPDVVHIATHALVDPLFPENSALIVASPDAMDGGTQPDQASVGLYDRRVSAEEITANWSLDAHLVTLSACETGLGAETPGEGFLGFTDAFFAAGARRLLVSLWAVDDQATCFLMERFYARWIRDGMECAAALRAARSDVRTYTDGLGRQPYAHPAYWAAFVLIGG